MLVRDSRQKLLAHLDRYGKSKPQGVICSLPVAGKCRLGTQSVSGHPAPKKVLVVPRGVNLLGRYFAQSYFTCLGGVLGYLTYNRSICQPHIDTAPVQRAKGLALGQAADDRAQRQKGSFAH